MHQSFETAIVRMIHMVDDLTMGLKVSTKSTLNVWWNPWQSTLFCGFGCSHQDYILRKRTICFLPNCKYFDMEQESRWSFFVMPPFLLSWLVSIDNASLTVFGSIYLVPSLEVDVILVWDKKFHLFGLNMPLLEESALDGKKPQADLALSWSRNLFKDF